MALWINGLYSFKTSEFILRLPKDNFFYTPFFSYYYVLLQNIMGETSNNNQMYSFFSKVIWLNINI